MKKILSILLILPIVLLVTGCEVNISKNVEIITQNNITTKKATTEAKKTEQITTQELCEHEGDFICTKCNKELISDEQLLGILDNFLTNGVTINLKNISYFEDDSSTAKQSSETTSIENLEIYLKPEIKDENITLNGNIYGTFKTSSSYTSKTSSYSSNGTYVFEAIIDNNDIYVKANLNSNGTYDEYTSSANKDMYILSSIEDLINYSSMSLDEGTSTYISLIEEMAPQLIAKAEEVLLPLIVKCVTTNEHRCMLVLKRIMNLLFNVEKISDGYEITIDFAGFNDTLTKVSTMKISEIVDYVFGDGTTLKLKESLTKAAKMNVQETIAFVEKQVGFTLQELVKAVNAILAVYDESMTVDALINMLTGGIYSSLNAILTDEDFMSLNICDLIGMFVESMQSEPELDEFIIDDLGEEEIMGKRNANEGETTEITDYETVVLSYIDQGYTYITTNTLPLDAQTLTSIKTTIAGISQMVGLTLTLDKSFKFKDLSVNIVIPNVITIVGTIEVGKNINHDYSSLVSTVKENTNFDSKEKFDAYINSKEDSTLNNNVGIITEDWGWSKVYSEDEEVIDEQDQKCYSYEVKYIKEYTFIDDAITKMVSKDNTSKEMEYQVLVSLNTYYEVGDIYEVTYDEDGQESKTKISSEEYDSIKEYILEQNEWLESINNYGITTINYTPTNK